MALRDIWAELKPDDVPGAILLGIICLCGLMAFLSVVRGCHIEVIVQHAPSTQAK